MHVVRSSYRGGFLKKCAPRERKAECPSRLPLQRPLLQRLLLLPPFGSTLLCAVNTELVPEAPPVHRQATPSPSRRACVLIIPRDFARVGSRAAPLGGV